MKLRLLISAVLVGIAATAVPAAGAGEPTRFTQRVDITFFAPGTSAACGFPVYVTQRGTANVLLWYGADGTTVVREMDWNAGWTTTLTAPTQGTSFSYPAGGQLRTYYPEGTDIGDPAIEFLTGFGNKIGDDSAEAGRVVTSAVVVFVDPSTGIPGVDGVGTLSATGHFLGDTFARRCEALTP
jgi:hypothetical protein